MSSADRWFRSGRHAGSLERITGICTGNPFEDGSIAAAAWWAGYQTGVDGFHRSPLGAA